MAIFNLFPRTAAVLVFVNGIAPALYTLSIRCTDTQATISLRCSLHISGFDDGEQTFEIEYGAYDLVTGTGLVDVDDFEHPPIATGHVERMSRGGADPPLKVLRLKMREPCPVWCPPSSGRIAPKHDPDAAYAHLQQLAEQTLVHVVFDYRWVAPQNQKMLQKLFDKQRRNLFFTLPRDPANDAKYRKADWTVFSPVDPPPYPVKSNKRPRSPDTSGLLPEAPSQKRVHSLANPDWSQTEKATTVPSPSPRSAFDNQLSPTADIPLPDNPLSQALRSPSIADIRLSDNPLPTIPKSPRPSPSLTTPHISEIPSATTHKPSLPADILSALESITDAVKDIVKDIVEDVVKDATDARLADFSEELTNAMEEMRREDGVELEESLDDHRMDMNLVKEDALAEVKNVLDDQLIEFKEKLGGFIEDAIIACEDGVECQRRHVTDSEGPSFQKQKKKLDEEGELLDNEDEQLDEEGQHFKKMWKTLEKEGRHLEQRRKHMAQRRSLWDRKWKLWEREQSSTASQ